MYDKIVTVFNYRENASGAVWYPHVLSGVDLNTDRGAILKKYGPDNADNAELHIACVHQDGKTLIRDAAGELLSWRPPKEWKSQETDLLGGAITFDERDFFVLGEWSDGIVNEDDYRDGFYEHMNSLRDFVFLITSVGGPYTLIPHFEIRGR